MAIPLKYKPSLIGVFRRHKLFLSRRIKPISQRNGFFIPRSSGYMKPTVHFPYVERNLIRQMHNDQ